MKLVVNEPRLLRPDRVADVGDLAVGRAQQRRGALEAPGQQIGMRGVAERAAELADEVRAREAGLAGHVLDSERLGVVRVGQVLGAQQVACGRGVGHGASIALTTTVTADVRRGRLSGPDRGRPRGEPGRAAPRARDPIAFEGLSAHVGEDVPLDPAALVGEARRGRARRLLLRAEPALQSRARGARLRGRAPPRPRPRRARAGPDPRAHPPAAARRRRRAPLARRRRLRQRHADRADPLGAGAGARAGGLALPRRAGRRRVGVCRRCEDGAWIDLYAFVPEPSPMIDIEMNNWWTATSPESPFVAGFLVSRQWPDGRRLDPLRLGRADAVWSARRRRPWRRRSEREQVPVLLGERFGLPGFELDADGRLSPPVRSSQLGWPGCAAPRPQRSPPPP